MRRGRGKEGRIGGVRPGRQGLWTYYPLALDGKVAGQSGPQTYFLWEVDPGPHEVASHAENVETLKLTTEAGKAYYVGVWMARSRLQLMNEETGRKGVAECKRAQSSF